MNTKNNNYEKMPISCASSGKTVGFELLLRQFNGLPLDIFNRYHELYCELSQPMLETIFDLDNAGKIREPGQYLFINLTPAQLISAGTLAFLTQRYQKQYQQQTTQDQEAQQEQQQGNKAPIPCPANYQVNKVVIELTEQNLDCDIERLKERLLLFICFGFTFAIDDFGVKASNFQRIFDVDHDFIKLDRGLLFRFSARKTDKAHLHHLVSFFHNLDKKVIVEGVETVDDYELAKSCGADYLQGFYFGLPEKVMS
jgi:hypothetical protein